MTRATHGAKECTPDARCDTASFEGNGQRTRPNLRTSGRSKLANSAPTRVRGLAPTSKEPCTDERRTLAPTSEQPLHRRANNPCTDSEEPLHRQRRPTAPTIVRSSHRYRRPLAPTIDSLLQRQAIAALHRLA